jgi:uncharacterized protein (TIGR02757 family)
MSTYLPLTTQNSQLKSFLDSKVDQYNRPRFIKNDPIVIPHLFSVQQDIEIMGFFAAMLAWGQRKTTISKCMELIDRMDGAPYDFILNHQESDLQNLLDFKHRTFNDTDLLYFISFLEHHYNEFDSLEDAFFPPIYWQKPSTTLRDEYLGAIDLSPIDIFSSSSPYDEEEFASPLLGETTVEVFVNYFRSYFLSLPDCPARTVKHISSPSQKSACKRLNMFLRWMVRDDDRGVDFGIWKTIKPFQLICPTDVHVERVARKLNLIERTQVDWKMALELTDRLREFDPLDPVKYDFALFGLGIEEKF